MSTHNICFHGEIRKNIIWIPPLLCSYEYTDAQADMNIHCVHMSEGTLYGIGTQINASLNFPQTFSLSLEMV